MMKHKIKIEALLEEYDKKKGFFRWGPRANSKPIDAVRKLPPNLRNNPAHIINCFFESNKDKPFQTKEEDASHQVYAMSIIYALEDSNVDVRPYTQVFTLLARLRLLDPTRIEKLLELSSNIENVLKAISALIQAKLLTPNNIDILLSRSIKDYHIDISSPYIRKDLARLITLEKLATTNIPILDFMSSLRCLSIKYLLNNTTIEVLRRSPNFICAVSYGIRLLFAREILTKKYLDILLEHPEHADVMSDAIAILSDDKKLLTTDNLKLLKEAPQHAATLAAGLTNLARPSASRDEYEKRALIIRNPQYAYHLSLAMIFLDVARLLDDTYRDALEKHAENALFLAVGLELLLRGFTTIADTIDLAEQSTIQWGLNKLCTEKTNRLFTKENVYILFSYPSRADILAKAIMFADEIRDTSTELVQSLKTWFSTNVDKHSNNSLKTMLRALTLLDQKRHLDQHLWQRVQQEPRQALMMARGFHVYFSMHEPIDSSMHHFMNLYSIFAKHNPRHTRHSPAISAGVDRDSKSGTENKALMTYDTQPLITRMPQDLLVYTLLLALPRQRQGIVIDMGTARLLMERVDFVIEHASRDDSALTVVTQP